jgi:hypothetical protein
MQGRSLRLMWFLKVLYCDRLTMYVGRHGELGEASDKLHACVLVGRCSRCMLCRIDAKKRSSLQPKEEVRLTLYTITCRFLGQPQFQDRLRLRDNGMHACFESPSFPRSLETAVKSCRQQFPARKTSSARFQPSYAFRSPSHSKNLHWATMHRYPSRLQRPI